MRVLVATTAPLGHIHPVVPLAQALASRGHEVAWATAPTALPAVERLGFATHAAGVVPRDSLRLILGRHPQLLQLPPPQRRPLAFSAVFAEYIAPAMADDLGPILDRVAPDLVLHDPAAFAVPPLAEARGIRHVTVAYSGELPPAVRAAAVRGVGHLWAEVGLAARDDLGLTTDGYLHPFPPALGQRPDHPAVGDLRPLNFDAAEHHPRPAWLDGLGTDRPLAFVTWGTEISGLAPWSAVLPALVALDLDAVVTVGGAADLDALAPLVAPATGRIRLERYLPHSFVLGAHGSRPAAAVVVSHGGAGTVLAAASAGIPQLVVPAAADHFDNADAVVGAGAALRLVGDEVTVEAVAAAVQRLLDDPAFRDAARSVAAGLAAMPHPDAVAAALTGEGGA